VGHLRGWEVAASGPGDVDYVFYQLRDVVRRRERTRVDADCTCSLIARKAWRARLTEAESGKKGIRGAAPVIGTSETGVWVGPRVLGWVPLIA